jgi:DNA-binding transcriptional LysR family regulator
VSDHVRRLEAELGATLVSSTGRGVRLTAEGQTFLVHAERVLADADEASNCVGHRTDRGSRVVGLGLTRNAPYYPIDEFVQRALAAIPDLQLRLPGQNSALVAAAVRDGDLDAALVILPVDPEGLEVRPLFSDEVLLVSADPNRTRRRARIETLAAAPVILYDATVGFADPTRRQLAGRAQAAGVSLIPRFEVEHPETAFQLAAKGLGDTIAARAVTRSPAFPANLSTVGFAEPLFDSFALITRRGAVPPVVHALTDVLEEWAADLADRLSP